MAAQPADWRQAAFEVYRLAWSELLSHWSGPQRDDIRYYVEELKEALLDLKQATIAEEPARAMQHLDEVTLLLAELRLRSAGE
jgi:hypothetical protein